MIQAGRFTTSHQDDLVVFLIGMRVNNWLRWREWMPVGRAMGPMLEYLYTHKTESGFLGAENFVTPDFRTTLMLQYWKSTEDLERFARRDPALHSEAWRNFYKYANNNQAVGIWHETYSVPAGNFECVYGNMPLFGLARATNSISVKEKLETMRQRMAAGRSE